MDDLIPRRRRKPEINIVPLVDVLTVLIFFFIVFMEFRGRDTLNLNLPQIETAGENQLTDQIEIGISPEGEFYYNGEIVDRTELEQLLAFAASLSKDRIVIIQGDRQAVLENLTYVMDQCRKVGLEQIRLQSR